MLLNVIDHRIEKSCRERGLDDCERKKNGEKGGGDDTCLSISFKQIVDACRIVETEYILDMGNLRR